MIKTETENGKSSITLKNSEKVPLQEEMVEAIVSMFSAFRKSVADNGGNPEDVDKDVDKILHNAYNRYHSIISSEKEKEIFSQNDEGLKVFAKDTTDNIVKKIDEVLQDEDRNSFLKINI